jgi:hypothetical protein
MVTINPDPHEKGYRYSPHRYVTAIFESRDALGRILKDLSDADFHKDQVEVFVGDDGAEKLDVTGKKYGIVTRFLRHMEEFFTDETDHLIKTDRALRHGGLAIEVFTWGNVEKKAEAARIMKAHGAHEVYYWGRWVIEKL